MRKIIGLTGVKGSGKTTAFGILQELAAQAGLGTVTEITLANRLKVACSLAFDIPRDHFDNPAVKEKELASPVYLDDENLLKVLSHFRATYDYDKHIRPHVGKVLHSPRKVAQYIGTEVLRAVDEWIHCNGAVQDLPQDGLFVVTDMRFWNEFNFFADNKEIEFYPVYVANSKAETLAGTDSHASEKYVLEIAQRCQRIDNNGSLAELKAQLQTLLTKVS